jgi:hypothetical protein
MSLFSNVSVEAVYNAEFLGKIGSLNRVYECYNNWITPARQLDEGIIISTTIDQHILPLLDETFRGLSDKIVVCNSLAQHANTITGNISPQLNTLSKKIDALSGIVAKIEVDIDVGQLSDYVDSLLKQSIETSIIIAKQKVDLNEKVDKIDTELSNKIDDLAGHVTEQRQGIMNSAKKHAKLLFIIDEQKFKIISLTKKVADQGEETALLIKRVQKIEDENITLKTKLYKIEQSQALAKEHYIDIYVNFPVLSKEQKCAAIMWFWLVLFLGGVGAILSI